VATLGATADRLVATTVGKTLSFKFLRIFLDEFMLAVPTITTLGIKNSCEIDEKYAIDIFLLALPALPKLTSLDFSEKISWSLYIKNFNCLAVLMSTYIDNFRD